MIDMNFFLIVVVQCFVLTLLVTAVRLFFPPEKITMGRLSRIVFSSLFIGVVVAYFGKSQHWEEWQLVSAILVGGLMADDAINFAITKGFATLFNRWKKQ